MSSSYLKQELLKLNEKRLNYKEEQVNIFHERIRDKVLEEAKNNIFDLPNLTIKEESLSELIKDLRYLNKLDYEDNIKLALSNVTNNVKFYNNRNGDYYGIHFDFLTEGDNNE